MSGFGCHEKEIQKLSIETRIRMNNTIKHFALLAEIIKLLTKYKLFILNTNPAIS